MTTQALRRPTFSLKKALSPVTNFIVRIFDAIVEARRLQAAIETAKYLKSNNKDFRHMSLSDIVNQIMDDTVTKGRE